MRWFPLVSLLLLACKPTPYQLGMKASADGRFLEASNHWIDALDRDINQTKPRDALLEYGPKAWEQLIDDAHEHEASGRYRQALASYEQAFDFSTELAELDLLEFDVKAAKIEVAEVRERWADHEWKSALEADQAAEWERAMEHYATYRELRPSDPLLDDRQGLTYLLWAEDDVANKRYFAAAEHYRQSHALTKRESSAAWAGAIEVAIARYGLSKNKCRYAAEHFAAAGTAVKGDPTLEADRDRAEDCARIGLALSPLEAQVELQVGDVAVASMLSDRIEREVERQGSRFLVQLVGTSEAQPAKRVEIGTRLTQAVAEPPAASADPQTAVGYQVVPCDKETLRYDPEALCSDEVEVSYVIKRAAQTVRLAGTVKIVDVDRGEQKTRPLEVVLHHDTTHASDFKVAGKPVQIAAEVDETHVEVPGEVLALDRAPEPLPPPNEVLGEAVALMAVEAGRVIVAAVDVEESPPDPTYLKVRDPVSLPTDLEFAKPVLAEPAPAPPTATIETIPAPEPVPEAPFEGPPVESP